MVEIISIQAGGLSATALSKGEELSRVVRFLPFLQLKFDIEVIGEHGQTFVELT
jgi:hypothetical protein